MTIVEIKSPNANILKDALTKYYAAEISLDLHGKKDPLMTKISLLLNRVKMYLSLSLKMISLLNYSSLSINGLGSGFLDYLIRERRLLKALIVWRSCLNISKAELDRIT